MNARMVQQCLIDLGFTFEKRQQENSDRFLWMCLDEDNIPLSSASHLSKVIWDVERQIGGVSA